MPESSRHENKSFGIRVKVSWDNFHSFLENFAERRDKPLDEKYQYLLSCRVFAIPIVNREPLEMFLDKKRLERVQTSVQVICAQEIQEICSKIDNILSKLERVKCGLFSISRRRSVQDAQMELAALVYFPEMTTTLQGIEALIQKGLLTSCYREMRKILEILYWVVLDDLLMLRLLKNAERIEKADINTFGTHPSPYRDVNKEWHEWARSKGNKNLQELSRSNKTTLSHLGELKAKIKPFTEFIHLYGRIKGYNWGKKKITNALIDNLSYSSLLLFTGLNLDNYAGRDDILKPMDGIGAIPFYEVKTLQEFAKMDLVNTIRQLKGKTLGQSDEKLIEELIKNESNQLGRFIIPPYPSNEFVIQLVSKLLDLGDVDNRYYGGYSYFVHTYPASMQIIPFSSALEFKILKNEISKFGDMILKTCEHFLENVRYRGKYSH